MELKIVEHPNDILNTKCDEASITDVSNELVDSMYDLMRNKNGVGLAATQIGVNKRFFLYSPDKSKANLKMILNPIITNHGKDIEYMAEGCLSVPNQKKELRRWRVIDVEYMEYKNGVLSLVKETLKGWNARVFQHELDHLDGIICMFKDENKS